MVMEIRQLRYAATVPMGVVTRDEPPGAVLARLLDELAVAPARVAEAA
jgi:hypothetical protein